MIPTLDTVIEHSGAKYSSGQKQLVCLARAAISKCKILVLDEATANMDTETEKMLHNVINELFSDCTILTIAHRLHSIVTCDKVIVLDNGNIVEFDDPKVLLNNKQSVFHKMCEDSKMDWNISRISGFFYGFHEKIPIFSSLLLHKAFCDCSFSMRNIELDLKGTVWVYGILEAVVLSSNMTKVYIDIELLYLFIIKNKSKISSFDYIGNKYFWELWLVKF